MRIDDVIDRVLAAEGGYTNNPTDRGGETNFGITAKVARANGYQGAMRDMPRDLARGIYRSQYVVLPGFDRIAEISAPIAAELVDTGVNMGPRVATRFLQRALNLLNRQGTDYPDIAADGEAGPATRGALAKYIAKRGEVGERRLLALLNAMQGERYAVIAEHDPKQEAFMFGWLDRIAA